MSKAGVKLKVPSLTKIERSFKNWILNIALKKSRIILQTLLPSNIHFSYFFAVLYQ